LELLPDSCALLVVDIQEKLFGKVLGADRLLERITLLYKGCKILNIPVVVTEQYPQGLGKTVLAVEEAPLAKTAFSCARDPATKKAIEYCNKKVWILCGIESHVCILQTVKSLLKEGFTPIVVQDAISSRNELDHSSSLQEMRALGVRITTVETVLFELIKDAQHPQFKELSRLIK